MVALSVEPPPPDVPTETDIASSPIPSWLPVSQMIGVHVELCIEHTDTEWNVWMIGLSQILISLLNYAHCLRDNMIGLIFVEENQTELQFVMWNIVCLG